MDTLCDLVDALKDSSVDMRKEAEQDLANGLDSSALTKHGRAKERADIGVRLERAVGSCDSTEEAIESLVDDIREGPR